MVLGIVSKPGPSKAGLSTLSLLGLPKNPTGTVKSGTIKTRTLKKQSIHAEFGVDQSGCLFHFCQSILRHMATNGLANAHNNNNPQDVRKTVQRLMSLPSVPSLCADQTFNAVLGNAQ
jgi:hypothetical protein